MYLKPEIKKSYRIQIEEDNFILVDSWFFFPGPGWNNSWSVGWIDGYADGWSDNWFNSGPIG